MPYEPLHHKYRPQMFSELVGQEAIATTLSNALEQKRIAPAYLFSGPRGTGKTSSARILAKSLNCLNSANPTPAPCGECEVCRAIANGSALDVIEIDAASNTGVDNIRELIERSQFAPVQCRYKVYVIDECLTGDTLVTTRQGLMRLEDSQLKGKQVLSFSEQTGQWEYKKVLRWLDQGTKPTLTIKTNNREIRCTDNHLIRTTTGWVQAKNVVAGMKILSPVHAGAAQKSINTAQTAEFAALNEDISSRATNTAQKSTISQKSWRSPKTSNPFASAGVANSWTFLNSSSKKAKALKASNITGNDILSERDMVSGKKEQQIGKHNSNFCQQNNWDWSTAHYSATAVSTTQTPTVAFPAYVGHTAIAKKRGWITKSHDYQNLNQNPNVSLTKDTVSGQSPLEPFAIPSFVMSQPTSSQGTKVKQFLLSGFNTSLQKDELGGIWTMVPSPSTPPEPQTSNFTQKVFPPQKISSWLTGLLTWDTQQKLSATSENKTTRFTTTSNLAQTQRDAGLATIDNSQSPQWTTNFETVESVTWGKAEPVYDIEVEDNHNFVANGLLVHNCHMLSVAAFNALLKTLEEPPAHVVFVLATTDPQRVLPTIISRCQRFDYRRIPLDAMVGHLRKIARNENIDIPLESITLVSQIANGGLRDAESLLDQLSLLSGEITPDKVWDLVGAVPERDLLGLVQVIHSNSPEAVIQHCRNLLNRGREPLVVLQNLASFYLNLLIAKTAPQRGDLIAVTQPTWQALCQEAQGWDLALILKGQQHLKDSEYQLKNTTQPRLWLEITLLGLLPSALANVAVTTEAIASPPVFVPAQVAPAQVDPAPTPINPPPQETITHPFGEITPAPSPKPVAPEPMAEIPSPARAENRRSPQTTPPTATPEPSLTNNHVNNNPSIEPPVQQPLTPTPPQSQPVVEPIQAAPPAPERQPIPQPAPATTPIAATSSSPTISALEREQLWETMLAQLQPLTTQQLLRQQGCLVNFNGAMAVIGIKSQPLLGIAKSKQKNIEAAFQKACQKKIKISFQVGHEPAGDVDLFAPSPASPEPSPTAIDNVPPPAPEPPVRSLPITPAPVATPFDAPTNLPDAPAPIPSPQPVPEQPPLQVIPNTPPPPAVQPPVSTQPQNGSANGHNGSSAAQSMPIAPQDIAATPPQREAATEFAPESLEATEENGGDRLHHLTQAFAEFFNGEVIELTHLAPDNTEEAIMIDTASPTPAPKPEPALNLQGRPPVTTSPEDDIPF
ncbi:DNA polymerase III subunit gamma/tau [[Limnothrix rosea] IAM M-220]|uniref:DNA polymerase III subunit gamma/tau n=1 Tax=[Limnothrix rosea] IAM M-220 TaxID=454133 RepID=UPI000963A921|nr:DNA polymerase III subunit gamma/tau [[Limnothrix rosea] IAM M-220]OKH13755.1 hypothetical protein NIES208_14875 [[Limnothrix rosea] IAM M-220]